MSPERNLVRVMDSRGPGVSYLKIIVTTHSQLRREVFPEYV